ncbi:response regulator [Caballeronia sp. RCC_10]|uniref:response regulator n=1 Tax=Caballeronia sp. RCC_10 TaxID=3239227 RepID=UPI0035241735
MHSTVKTSIWTARRTSRPDPLRILVVDDYAIGAEAVALALACAGHETRFALNGSDAMARVQVWAPDIAILDINMPSPDGFQLAALLRARDNLSYALIIAHTSLDESAVRPRGVPAGFDGFCQKGGGVSPLQDIIPRMTSS